MDEIGKTLGRDEDEWSAWSQRLGLAGLMIKVYPDARKDLLARGRTAAEVEAMSALQVVMTHFLERYDEIRDENLKWLNLPSWQMWAGLEGSEPRLREMARRTLPLFMDQLMPGVWKPIQAQLRLEWHIAGLRSAEALRMYAAGHKGKPPQKLTDITLVPLPLDPFTGRTFEAGYSLKDGKGTLELVPRAGLAVFTGRRYELTAPSE